MPSIEFPILDGICPSWADVKVTAVITGGPVVEMKDIKAINSGRSLEVGVQRGAGGRKKKRTTGQPDDEGSITLYRSGFQDALRALAAVAPQRGNERMISLVHFNIIWQYSVLGDPQIYERRMKGCRWMGDTMNDTEGSDPQEVEVPLSVMQIADVIDGVEVVLV
jgi:hypothetical protein